MKLILTAILSVAFMSAFAQSPIVVYKSKDGKLYNQNQFDSLAMKYAIAKEHKFVSGDTTLFTISFFPKNVSSFKSAYEGKPMPKMTLVDIDGKPIDYAGKKMMVNFWSTSCGPCIMEMPQLNELKVKYGKEILFVAIAPEPKKEVLKLLQKHRFDFVMIADAERLFQELKIDGYPKNFFVNANGVVQNVKEGTPMVKDPATGEWKPNLLGSYGEILNKLE